MWASQCKRWPWWRGTRFLLSNQKEKENTGRTVSKSGLTVVQWVPEGRGWRVAGVGSGAWRESSLPLKTERRAEESGLTCPQIPSPPQGILMPPEMNQQQSIHARTREKTKGRWSQCRLPFPGLLSLDGWNSCGHEVALGGKVLNLLNDTGNNTLSLSFPNYISLWWSEGGKKSLPRLPRIPRTSVPKSQPNHVPFVFPGVLLRSSSHSFETPVCIFFTLNILLRLRCGSSTATAYDRRALQKLFQRPSTCEEPWCLGCFWGDLG